jgi:hypothetical protein
MNKKLKYALYLVGGVTFIYLAFVYKRANVDTGYGSTDIEKQILVTQVMALMGVPDNEANRGKYSKMSVEQLRKILSEVEPVKIE